MEERTPRLTSDEVELSSSPSSSKSGQSTTKDVSARKLWRKELTRQQASDEVELSSGQKSFEAHSSSYRINHTTTDLASIANSQEDTINEQRE